MSVNIRRAERSDAGAVVSLIRRLAEFERLEPPDVEAEERLIRHGWGERPKFETWLAEVDGSPVGYLILYETFSTFLAKPTLFVEDIFVVPEMRGRGIGRALFHHAMRLARERGCGRMEWCCLDWNEPAQRFYESLGARHLTEWHYYRLTEDMLGASPEGELDAA